MPAFIAVGLTGRLPSPPARLTATIVAAFIAVGLTGRLPSPPARLTATIVAAFIAVGLTGRLPLAPGLRPRTASRHQPAGSAAHRWPCCRRGPVR
jgi:hypothetical protein